MRAWFIFLVVICIICNVFVMYTFYALTLPPHVVTGKAIGGILSIFIEGGTKSLNISSPLNTTYFFSVNDPYYIDLNVSATFDVDTWWYTLYDLRHDTVVYSNVSFTPNTTLTAVRWQNRLQVYANSSVDGEIISREVIFYVSVPNSAPLLRNVSNSLLACEGSALSYVFNISDVDEDPLSISVSPTTPFFIIPASTSGGVVNSTAELFSGTLGKNRVGFYQRNVSINDGQYVDSKRINITVIEINNAPTVSPIGVQTVWTQGQNSTFYHQVQVSDTESGNQNSGNFTFNLTFLSGTPFFNISQTGVMNVSPTLAHVGVYNLSVCVNDTALQNPSPDIGFCGQTGGSRTTCTSFSLTVTNQNRAPNITSYYPQDFILNGTSTAPFFFNLSTEDLDGTVPDVKWYLGSTLIETDTALRANFSYTFGCGVFGNMNVTVNVTDGLETASLSWNLSVALENCPAPSASGSGGGAGGGGGAFPSACQPRWGCTEWDVCTNLNQSHVLGLISTAQYDHFGLTCALSRIMDVNCGYQIRQCADVNACQLTPAIIAQRPVEIQGCFYTSSPSCTDGLQNCHNGQCELLVDCGGPCNACATCSDGIQNQGEQGVDCSGPCPMSCVPDAPFIQNKWVQYLLIGIILLLLIFIILMIRRISKLRKDTRETKKSPLIENKLR